MRIINKKIHHTIAKCWKETIMLNMFRGCSYLKLFHYILLCLVLLFIYPIELISNPLVAVQGKIVSVKQIPNLNSCDIEIIVEMYGQYTYPNLYRSQSLINDNVPELSENLLSTVHEEYQVFRDYGLNLGTWYYQLPSYEFEYGIFEGNGPVSITLKYCHTIIKGDIDKNGFIEMNDAISVMRELVK